MVLKAQIKNIIIDRESNLFKVEVVCPNCKKTNTHIIRNTSQNPNELLLDFSRMTSRCCGNKDCNDPFYNL